MQNHRALLVLVSSLALLAGCGRDAVKAEPSPMASAAPMASGATGATAMSATTTSADLAVGKPPPDFTATAHDGTVVTLSKLKGQPVVVYFYPKDETPGCTVEASSFRDAWKDLSNKGVTVIGISADSADSHKAFAKAHDLPFHLVSDPTGTIATSFGVPFKNGYIGRQTFIIGTDGNLKKIYRDVDPNKHAADVLAALQS